MLFNSFEFAVFFPVVTLLYFATPARRRWIVLLIASAVFYMAFIPAYLLILLALIVIDYTAALLIERAKGPARRRLLLVSVASNIGILGAFKYYNFLATNVDSLARVMGYSPSSLPLLSWVLPIGLSFHTFQSMAYTIEVYRGRFPAERHLGYYALYVMYYPQLVAGPIERPYNLLPQLRREQVLEPTRIASGLKLMAWGLFKKVVIADRLAFVVNAVYAQPSSANGAALIVATVFFAWQIYCDFSGYTDIAIGAAEVMGIDLMCNFRRPYLATSTRDFWTRWHVSLSSWFRDYVYIPLGGNRRGRARTYRNLVTIFVLCGFWHGAAWTFVVWGLFHGLVLVIERITGFSGDPTRLPLLALRRAVTMLLVVVSWVFFNSASLPKAFRTIGAMFSPQGTALPAAVHATLNHQRTLVLCLAVTVVLLPRSVTVGRLLEYGNGRLAAVGRFATVALAGPYAAILVAAGTFSPFIYYQF